MDDEVLIEDVNESEYFDTSKEGFFSDRKLNTLFVLEEI
jgi:hypothetical protein